MTQPKFETLEELMAALKEPAPLRRRPGIRLRRARRRLRDARLFVRRYYERGRYGISQEDTWSLFYFVAGVIADGCAALRERGISHPASMEFDEWQQILTEIEEGFRLAKDGAWDVSEENQVKVDLAMKHFKKYFYGLWD